jgi:hypothetical protein
VQGELELGDHAEVPAATTQPPEQVVVLGLAGLQPLTLGGDQLEAGDVVAGQPVAPCSQPIPPPRVRPPTPVWETLPAVVASP